MTNLWNLLAQFLVTRRRWIVVVGLLLAIGAAWRLPGLDFSTDILELMPDSLPAARAFRDYDAHLTQSDDLTVALEVAEPADPSELDQAVPAFVAALERIESVAAVRSGLPGSADDKIFRALQDRFHLLLDGDELARLVARLKPDSIAARMARNRQRLLSSPGPLAAERIQQDPLGVLEIAGDHFRKLSRNNTSVLPGDNANGGAFGSADGRLRLLQVTVRGNARDAYYCQRLTDQVRTALEETRAALPKTLGSHLRIGLTGRCAFAADISRRLRGNIISSGVSSMLLVMLVFWVGFRRLWPLAAITMTLSVAVLSCLGLGAAWFGQLNIITTSFAAIMIGLGVDYGILLYNHLARASQADAVAAWTAGLRANGPGIILSAVTTAAAFGSITLAGSSALRQFGLLAALGILLCALWMLLFFASLCASESGKAEAAQDGGWLGRLGGTIARRPKTIVSAAGALAVVALLFLLSGSPRGVTFDANPESVRFRNIEAEQTLRRIFEKTGQRRHTLIVLQRGADWSQLADGTRKLSCRLEDLLTAGSVARFDSPAPLLPSESRQRANLELLSTLDFAGVRRAFTEALQVNGFEPQQFGGFFRWLDVLQRQTAAPLSALMTPARLFGDLPEWRSLAGRMVNPDALQSATYVYPAQPLNTALELAAWRKQLGADGTTREVTGWDALVAEMQPQLRRDFLKILAATSVWVLGCLAITYRRVTLIGLTLLPLGLAILFLLATMRLAGVQFNVANFFALPLVVGCGIDYGIHVVNAWQREQGNVAMLIGTTGRALVMNALTTCFGFGSLVLANHTGLMTLGFVVGVGILWLLVCALIVLPATLVWRRGVSS